MNYFGYDEIATAVVVLLGLAGSFVLIGNGVELVRKWITAHKEKQTKIESKVDYLKGENQRHNTNYQDVVNLKRQVGKIQESVEKIDQTLDDFIISHGKEMAELNEETALQTGAIKSLLDNAIKTATEPVYLNTLNAERKKIDEFLIHRGR